MPEAPIPRLAVWLMQGSVCTALGKSWVRMRPFSPPFPFPLARVRVEQCMASLMDCCRKTRENKDVREPDGVQRHPSLACTSSLKERLADIIGRLALSGQYVLSPRECRVR